MKTRRAALPRTHRNHQSLLFQDLAIRQVVADFSCGYLSSDGGALLLRQIDRGLGLMRTLAQAFTDQRDPRYCDHTLAQLLAQRRSTVSRWATRISTITIRSGTIRFWPSPATSPTRWAVTGWLQGEGIAQAHVPRGICGPPANARSTMPSKSK